ncbi:unnamed protein product [Didymodactylos carnosus]|nr:unnamed protein product [Didymodactylos carnosus]CAF3911739.1 unnamed protein product [Didymodactylos carnosus]
MQTILYETGIMDLNGFVETALCSHMMAVYLFTDSIRDKCPYLAYACTNYDDFRSSKCSLSCEDGHCNRLGYYASSKGAQGSLYLVTQDTNALQFCYYAQTRGQIVIMLSGTLQTASMIFDNDETTFKRGGTVTRFIPLTADIGQLQYVDVSFKRTDNWLSASLYSPIWNFEKLTMLDGNHQQILSYCPTNSLHTGTSVRFTVC